jgi:hypothetical protein
MPSRSAAAWPHSSADTWHASSPSTRTTSSGETREPTSWRISSRRVMQSAHPILLGVTGVCAARMWGIAAVGLAYGGAVTERHGGGQKRALCSTPPSAAGTGESPTVASMSTGERIRRTFMMQARCVYRHAMVCLLSLSTYPYGTCTDRFENCTLLLSSYRDPFLQSRTVWNDEACSATRPYVCEKRGLTSRCVHRPSVTHETQSKRFDVWYRKD